MAITVERIAGGVYSGSGAAPSGTTASLTTDGTNRLCVAVCFTHRQLNGAADYHEVQSVSGGTGMSWVKKIDADFTYNDATASGSFPNNYWHCDVFAAFAAAQQSGSSLTFTMAPAGDTFVNNGWAVVFVIDGVTDLDTDLTNLVINFALSGGGASTVTSGSLDTDSANPLVIFCQFTHNLGGGTHTHSLPSGYTTAATVSGNSQFSTNNSSGGIANISASWKEYASAQSGLVLTGDSKDFWWTAMIALANVSASTATARVTSVAAEVLEGVASNARATSVAAEVLEGVASNARVTSVAAEVLIGLDPLPPLDGGKFLEARFQLRPSQSYSEADYDSIWSIGDRNAGNHMTFGEYDLTIFPGATMGSSHDGNVAFPFGSGLSISSNPLVTGAGVWIDFGTEFVDIRGFKFIGTEEYAWADDETWAFYGAADVGLINDEPYPVEFDAFTPSQQIENTDLDLFESEWEFTARENQIWTHYEFVFVGASQALSEARFANEILYKVAHSSLDGGDRRLTNSRPDKRVAFTMSSAWTYTNSPGSFIDPAVALFDGATVWINGPVPGGDAKNGLGDFAIISKAGGTGGAEQDTIGAWLQFEYPREVIPRHICFVVLTQVEEYTGDVPQHYGTWHWEFSKDGGSTWVAVGSAWSFAEDTQYMIAPRTGAWELTHGSLGQGATHWRMVLNSGPAFRNNYSLAQILFDLNDPGSLSTNFRIDFSDDVDGSLPTPTIVGSNPYTVSFSDGSSDVLTFALTNTPNFDGTIAFSDGTSDRLEYVGSFSPTFYPQTVVVATGRR